MNKKIINFIVNSVIENATEVKLTYDDISQKIECNTSVVNYVYADCSNEILLLEEYCNLIGKMLNSSESVYDMINNAFRFTINTKYGNRADFVTLDKTHLEYYLRVRIDW